MTTHFQTKTFKRNHQDNSNPYQAQLKQLEKDYIEKFTVAQNIFNRVKHYTSELEILISGVIKVYCGTGFSEKHRIDFLLKNIHNELHDFEERITISEVIEQYDLYPEDLKQKVSPRHLFNDSLLSSTRSDTNTMLAIKNEVKDLISDYRDAVDKLKEENKTIQALVNDRKHNKDFDDKENISFNITRSPNYLKREKSLDESEIEEKVEEGKKVSKYAELSRFINDLNKKKEENMRKLATIETRLATIRKNTADEDQGVLKASDLNREEDRPAVMRSAKKQSMEPGSVSKGKRTHEDQKDYLNYMKEVTELSKRKRLGRQQKEPLSVNRSKKSANESSVLEDEIDQLNKEIDTIKGLLDSAIIQKKYQQK